MNTQEIIAMLKDSISNGETLENITEHSGEWIESLLPIYTNDIVTEWQNMDGEYDNRGAKELGALEELSITGLMLLDLYLFYSDKFYHAISEIENALQMN